MNANPDNLAAWVMPNGDGYSVVYAPGGLLFDKVPRPAKGYQDIFPRLIDAYGAAEREADLVRVHPDCHYLRGER